MPLIILLWLQSGAFKFVQDIGPHNGRLFLVVCNIAVFATAVLRNLARGRLMPHRPGFWTAYLLFFVFLSASITWLTASYEPKSLYQVFRYYSGYLTFISTCYVVFTFAPSPGRLLRNFERIVIVLFALDVASYFGHTQLFAAGFGSPPDSYSLDAFVNGAVRFSPFGMWAAVFCVFYAVYMLLQSWRGGTSASSAPLYPRLLLLASLGVVCLTFTRSVIVPMLMLLFCLLAYSFRPDRKWFKAVFFMASVGMLSMIVTPFIAKALITRTELGLGAGLVDTWRAFELRQAEQVINANPLIGIGLGSPYSDAMSDLAGGSDTGYGVNANFDIHNTYASIALNYGLLGLAAFLLGVIKFLVQRSPFKEPERAFVVGAKLLLACSSLAGLYSGPFFNGVDCFYQALVLSYATLVSGWAGALGESAGRKRGYRYAIPNAPTRCELPDARRAKA